MLRSTQACLPAYSNFTIFTLGVEERANNTLYLQLHDAHSLMRVVWQHFFVRFDRDDDQVFGEILMMRSLLLWEMTGL